MRRLARILGIAVQALVLGTLLAFAVAKLLASAGDVTIFRYEGF